MVQFVNPELFYFHYGTGKVYSVSSSDNLTEEDLITYWDLVEEADRTEIQSFVDFKVFKAVPYQSTQHTNIVDAIGFVDGKRRNCNGREMEYKVSPLCMSLPR